MQHVQCHFANLCNNSRFLVELFFSDLFALSLDEEDDDVWCIDHRGLLTLSVSKDTYERLGLLGKKLTFGKELDERYGEPALLKDPQGWLTKRRPGQLYISHYKRTPNQWPIVRGETPL